MEAKRGRHYSGVEAKIGRDCEGVVAQVAEACDKSTKEWKNKATEARAEMEIIMRERDRFAQDCDCVKAQLDRET